MPTWKTINITDWSCTTKMKVEGGYLYHCRDWNEQCESSAMVFVPVKEKEKQSSNINKELPKTFYDDH